MLLASSTRISHSWQSGARTRRDDVILPGVINKALAKWNTDINAGAICHGIVSTTSEAGNFGDKVSHM